MSAVFGMSLEARLEGEDARGAEALQRISGVDQQLINAAREEREAALSAYANGELSLVELLDFERSLSRAEIQLLQSYDTAIEAWHRANQSLAGIGLEGDNQ